MANEKIMKSYTFSAFRVWRGATDSLTFVNLLAEWKRAGMIPPTMNLLAEWKRAGMIPPAPIHVTLPDGDAWIRFEDARKLRDIESSPGVALVEFANPR